jgi:hypothetical protein
MKLKDLSNNMKIYTIYSPTHKTLYENYFKKTLPEEFDLFYTEIPQECPSGEFYKNGWSETCFKKVEYFIQICEENMGSKFVFSDVDVQFFGNIKDVLLEELEDYDIACQSDNGTYCAGFFICNANEKTLNMKRKTKLL